MAHVSIHASAGDATLVIDGVDFTKSVLAEGFEVTGLDRAGFEPPHIRMTLVADVLEMDLPGAVLEVLHADESESA